MIFFFFFFVFCLFRRKNLVGFLRDLSLISAGGISPDGGSPGCWSIVEKGLSPDGLITGGGVPRRAYQRPPWGRRVRVVPARVACKLTSLWDKTHPSELSDGSWCSSKHLFEE